MDSFAQALANSRSTNYSIDQTGIREENHQKALIEKIDRANEGVLANPGLLDNRVADMVNQLSPSANKPKYGKFATKTDAVDANMPEDHPLVGLAGRVKTSLQAKLASSQGTGKTFEQLSQEAMRENLSNDDILKTFEYKAKADSSYRNFFGFFNEDSSVRVPDALKSDYANWKNNIMQQRKNSEELNKDPDAKDYTVNALLGTAAGIGLGAASVAAGVLSGGTAAPLSAAGLIASEALIGGALAIPGTYGGTKTRQAYRKTEAGTFHEGDLQDKVIGGTVAATMFALGARSSGVKTMLASGAIGGTLGAVSPDLGMDLAGFMGMEALAKAGGAKALKSALNAGKVSDSLKEALKVNPQASNIIRNYDIAQEAKLNEARVTAEAMDKTMRETAANMDSLHSADLKAAKMDVDWSKFGSKSFQNPDLEGAAGIVDEFNTAMRDATPGGRNVLSNAVDTRQEFPMTGRGKKRVASVPPEEIDKARSAMHFNQFLADMASDTTHAEYADKIRALKDEEAYQDLFSNYVYQGSANEALETISMDGLNRAMGDGAGGNWKMLSLGSRVQIVNAEEQASASLLARSVGNEAAATRLDAIKKPIIAATKKAMKGSPEDFAPALEAAAGGKGSPYLVDGKLNLVQLQQDLSHYGFYTLHQFAHSTAEEMTNVLKTPRKWDKFKQATEALRSISATPNITKLGVASAVGLGAYNFGDNKAEAGIINADTMKAISEAGGRIWNYSMQKFAPKVAEEIISRVKPSYIEDLTSEIKKAQSLKDFDAVDKLTRKATKGEYTLSDIRNIVTDNRNDITWAQEKELLNKAGIDTDGGVVTLAGVKNDNFNFGYKDSADHNLYGPGSTYSTTGAIHDFDGDGVKAGTEDITAGYSGIKKYWNKDASLDELAERSTENVTLNDFIESVDSTLHDVSKELSSTKNPQLAKMQNELIKLSSDLQDTAFPEISSDLKKFLADRDVKLINTKLTGPNTRMYHFVPDKPFDIQAQYNPKDFGIAGEYLKKPSVSGGELLDSLGDISTIHQIRTGIAQLNPTIESLQKTLSGIDDDAAGIADSLLSQLSDISKDSQASLLETVRVRGQLRRVKADLEGVIPKEDTDKLSSVIKTLDYLERTEPKRLANDYLKELGYDSITHVGGANTGQSLYHRVWIPLKDEMLTPFLSVQEQLAKSFNIEAAFKGATAAAIPATILPSDEQGKAHGESVLNTAKEYFFKGLDSIGSLIAPKDADAAVLDTLVKVAKDVKVSPAVADYVKVAGKDSKQILKEVSDANLFFRELPEKAISTKGFRTAYLQTAPATEHDIPSIIAGTSQVFPGQKSLTSPQFGVMTMFKNVVRGDEFKGSAAAQLAHGQSVVADNVRKELKAFNNVMKTYDVPVSELNSREIAAHMAPIQEAFEDVSFPLRAQEVALGENKKALAKFLEDIGDDPEAKVKYADALKSRDELNTSLTDNIVKLNEQFELQKAKLEDGYKYVAYRYPEARISLALEDTADFQKYPWLPSILKPNEQKAVIALKDTLNNYRERITEIMGEDSTISGEYVRHSRGPSRALDKRMNDLQQFLDKAGLRGEEIIAMSKLQSRTKYSMQMIPDITRNFGEYVPDVETRLMNADFWKLGKPGGWDAVRQSSIVQNSPTLKAFFQQIADSVKPPEETYLRNLSTKYASLESARLLFGSVSAPFKHAMKIVGDMRTFGVTPTLSVMPQAAAVAGRNFVRSKLESLERVGLVESGTAQNAWKNKKVLDEFVAGAVNQRGMMDYLTDIEKKYGKPSDSLFERVMTPINNATSVGIKAVETFDRTTSVLMALKMAGKKGMTGQQAMYSIYDTILKNNFLSGQLNSSWARDPNIRALFLFQNTPFKIWERRIADAVVAKKDLKTALGIIKNTELPAAYEELQGIGRFIKQAEISFKSGIIKDSLNRDVFGQSTSKQLMKEMLLVGGMLSGGSALGMNLTGHLLHAPFVKQDEGDVKLSVSPIVQAGFRTIAGKVPTGYEDYTPEDHFFAANFLRNWYGSTGPLLLGSKFKRLSSNDIPEMYQNSKWKFLFSIPAAGQGH